eukprot:m.332243 g.332243  ORF g.332243 m.332243 type:complete len:88 (-) comp16906_c0_seq1:23-286(-)
MSAASVLFNTRFINPETTSVLLSMIFGKFCDGEAEDKTSTAATTTMQTTPILTNTFIVACSARAFKNLSLLVHQNSLQLIYKYSTST